MDADHLTKKYDDELEVMGEVTSKTSYETGATVCQLDQDNETRHITPTIVGDDNRVVTPGCDFGSRKATIHSHPYQPPSKEDLKAAVTEQYTNCIMMSDIEPTQTGFRKNKNTKGTLVCFEGDEKSDVEKAYRTPENRADHLQRKDIEQMENSGFKVSISTL